MKERGVDFILCPTYVGVASELGTSQYWAYTAIWNILDQPCTVFPTGLHVNSKIDITETEYTPRSDIDEREYKKCRSPLILPWESFEFITMLCANIMCTTCRYS